MLIPRVSGTEGIQTVRDHIVTYVQRLPGDWKVELDAFEDETPMGPRSFVNIVASFGADTYPRKKRTIFACHYDSKFFEAPSYFVGATDSAVSCALLLHLGKVVSTFVAEEPEPTRPAVFDLIFFDGEEAFVEWTHDDSLYGSRHLAQKWASEVVESLPSKPRRIQNVRGMVLLDLIGAKNMQFMPFIPSTFSHYVRLREVESLLASQYALKPSSLASTPPVRKRKAKKKTVTLKKKKIRFSENSQVSMVRSSAFPLFYPDLMVLLD